MRLTQPLASTCVLLFKKEKKGKKKRTVLFIRFAVTREQAEFPSFALRNMMQLAEFSLTVLIGEK